MTFVGAIRLLAPTREGKTLHGGRYFTNFYTNDTNGHDITEKFRYKAFYFKRKSGRKAEHDLGWDGEET